MKDARRSPQSLRCPVPRCWMRMLWRRRSQRLRLLTWAMGAGMMTMQKTQPKPPLPLRRQKLLLRHRRLLLLPRALRR